MKHFLYLLLWGGSLYVACTHEFDALKIFGFNLNFLAGPMFLLLFFLFTTYKTLGNMLTVCAIIGIVCFIFPPVGAIIAAASFVFMLLKLRFLFQHWRVLLVGIYAYFGYLFIIFATNRILGLSAGAIFFVVLLATANFHRLTNKIYRRGYDTDKTFAIIGMTPYTIISVFLPFLRINFEGQEIFHGLFSDDIGIDINLHAAPEDIFSEDIADAMKEMGITTADVIKATGFDINDLMDVQSVSQGVQASIIGSTAYGLFKVANYDKDFSVRNEDGSVEIISAVDDTHSIIKNQRGEQIGSIYLDRKNNREVVALKDGFAYAIDNATGNILDRDGKILGRIIADQDTRLLTDGNGNVLRKFEADGTILDANNRELAVAAV